MLIGQAVGTSKTLHSFLSLKTLSASTLTITPINSNAMRSLMFPIGHQGIPLISADSVFCSTYDDEDQGWLGGTPLCDLEPRLDWNYYDKSGGFSSTSSDESHTAIFNSVRTNNRCTGCNDE